MNGYMRYTHEPLFTIFCDARAGFASAQPGATWQAEVVNPDVSTQHFAGERITIGQLTCRYRPLKSWFEFAESLGCVLQTPTVLDDGFIRITLRLLDENKAWHLQSAPSGAQEKYGIGSGFDRIEKFEDPVFITHFMDAVEFAQLSPDARCLILGVNRGCEVDMVYKALGPQKQHPCVF